MTYGVGISIQVIPDGIQVIQDGTKEIARLSLSLAPQPPPFTSATADIRDWPNEVAAKSDQLRVLIADVGGLVGADGTDNRTISNVRELGIDPNASKLPKAYGTDATRVWKAVFAPYTSTGGPDEMFDALVAVLTSGGVKPPSKRSASARPGIGGYSTRHLARMVDAMSSSAAAATMVSHLSRRIAGGEASGLPAAAFDAGRPSRGWWLKQHALWLGVPGRTGDRLTSALFPGPDPEIPARVAHHQRALAGDFETRSAAWRSALEKTASFRSAAASLGEKLLEPEFWTSHPLGPGANPSEDERRNFMALAEELHRFQLATRADPASASAPQPDPATAILQAAARKFTAMLGAPTIAKFFNLIVDLQIPAAPFSAKDGKPIIGAIAVDIAKQGDPLPDPANVIWTTYAHTASGYFGPATRQQSLGNPVDQNYWIQDGLLNLRTELASNLRRFSLEADDTAQIVDACQRAATAAVVAQRDGDSTSPPPPLPERQSRGIAMVDSGRVRAEAELAARATDLKRRAAAHLPIIKDAEDLVHGYRIDVALVAKSSMTEAAPSDTRRWRSLSGRTVRYPADGVFAGDPLSHFASDPDVAVLSERDDGYVRPMTRLDTTPPTPHETLFDWQGDNLAAAARPDAQPGNLNPNDKTNFGQYTWPSPKDDLAISTTLDVPTSGNRCPAPLRLGRAYWFGARLLFANGCSLSIDDAAKRYVDSTLALGDDEHGDQPYAFTRETRIRSPTVLLGWNDPLVQSPPGLGQTIDDLVVLAGRDTVARYLAPPGNTFDLSEQYGVFDAAGTPDEPYGAYVNRGGYQPSLELNRSSGDFPIALNNIWYPKSGTLQPGPVPAPSGKDQSRGSVLAPNSRADRLDTQVYPDPGARFLCARLLGNDGAELAVLSQPLAFWQTKPSDACPIFVQVSTSQSGLGSARAKLSAPRWKIKLPRVDDDSQDPNNPVAPLVMSGLLAQLAPGQTGTLELWCSDDANVMASQHSVVKSALSLASNAARIASLGNLLPFVTSPLSLGLASLASGAATGTAVQACMMHAPTAQVHQVRTLNLTHAVRKPAKAPAFAQSGSGKPMRAVVVSVDGDYGTNTPGAPVRTWPDIVRGFGGSDPMTWSSEVGGATAFFVGSVMTDRVTTGRLRCVANWQEYTPDCYTLDSLTNELHFTPRTARARLFALDAEPAIHDGSAVSLTWSDADFRAGSGALRGLSYGFADGKARKLSVTLVATSRFTSNFPDPASSSSMDAIGSDEAASSGADLLWVPCTFRPPPPEVDRIVPIFKWSTTRSNGGKVLNFRRDVGLRIFLKRSWWASGEDELLALVFQPDGPGKASANDPCSLVAPFDQYLTRRGADPIHHSGSVSGWLDPATLGAPAGPPAYDSDSSVDDDGQKRSLALVLNTDQVLPGSTGPTSTPVRALGFTVTKTGNYCDIIFNKPDAYFPFVQLGLARLQVHSVPGQELSHPLALMAQVPPLRSGTVTFTTGTTLDFRLQGAGFDDAPDNVGNLRRSFLRLRLLQVVQDDDVPHAPQQGQPIDWQDVDPAVEQVTQAAPGGLGVNWRATVTLPQEWYVHHYGLLVEEFEYMNQRDSAQPVPRSPSFSQIIDLGEWD